MQHQIPVIYFLGTSPGRYQPIIPTFIVGWHPERLRVQLSFGALVGASAKAVPPDAPERRYTLREVKARLHQASFRDAVLAAYRGRCAISRLPEPRLLDAAHIVRDADEQLGQPIVSNGLPLTLAGAACIPDGRRSSPTTSVGDSGARDCIRRAVSAYGGRRLN